MGDEGLELLGVGVRFPADCEADRILEQFADQQMVAEMKKVFFAQAPNSLGHSYAGLMLGPGGRQDLQDVITLLRQDPWTKRAIVTLSPAPNGKVPCINSIQFLVRNHVVQTLYFARGQDAFKKFFADALCIATMAQTVAKALGLAVGEAEGFIGSAHVYHRDRPAILEFLEAVRDHRQKSPEAGVLA